MARPEAIGAETEPGLQQVIMVTKGPTEEELWNAFRGAWELKPQTVGLSIMPGVISYAIPLDQELRKVKKDWLLVKPLLDKPARVMVRVLALAYEIENPAAGRSMIVEFREIGGFQKLLPEWLHWDADVRKIHKGACAYLSYNTMALTGGLTLGNNEPLINARISIEQVHTMRHPRAYIIDGTNETWPVTRIFRNADLIKQDPSH